jgi:hypothetical protein
MVWFLSSLLPCTVSYLTVLFLLVFLFPVKRVWFFWGSSGLTVCDRYPYLHAFTPLTSLMNVTSTIHISYHFVETGETESCRYHG